MYSQPNNDRSSSVGVEKLWNMDLVTRRTKRRSMLGKGRSSLRLSVAGIIPPPVSPGTNAIDKSKGGARKPIADDVLRHFARINGINPLNPFASQLKESISSGAGGQSLDENDQEASCSAPSSSSEGSARKEDPDITGVFFMDDVESVKKRHLNSVSSSASSRTGLAEKDSSHTVSCNLMSRSPFAKEPLKDQALRLNRAADERALSIRSKAGATALANNRRTMDARMTDRAPREYSSSRQPVSPVEPVLKSGYSDRNLNISSPVEPVLKSCFSDRNLKLSAISASSSLSSSVLLQSGASSLQAGESADSSLRRSLSTTDLVTCIAATKDARRAASEMHFEEMCMTNKADDLEDLFVTKRRSFRPTTDHQMDTKSDHQSEVKLDSHRSTDQSRGRYSVASFDNKLENNTKRSRPSVMSDLIINHNKNSDVSSKLFKQNDVQAKHMKHHDDNTSSKVLEPIKENKYMDDMSSKTLKQGNDVSKRNKYIDDLLKRIDLSVKANKHTDDNDDTALMPEKSEKLVDESSSKIVNEVGVFKSNLDESSKKFVNYDKDNSSEIEVCNKINRTLVFDDCEEEEEDVDKTFLLNESVCNNTLKDGDGNASAKVSVGSTELRGKTLERIGLILEYVQESSREFKKKRSDFVEGLKREQAEFVEGLKRQQAEFVRSQNERIEKFVSSSDTFTQQQTSKLAAMFEEVANLTAGNDGDEEVFHTAQKKPLELKADIANDSSVIYSQLKSDFKCLKTPNARSCKKSVTNLNRTILTPHSMSVCVQEQVSKLFDALD